MTKVAPPTNPVPREILQTFLERERNSQTEFFPKLDEQVNFLNLFKPFPNIATE